MKKKLFISMVAILATITTNAQAIVSSTAESQTFQVGSTSSPNPKIPGYTLTNAVGSSWTVHAQGTNYETLHGPTSGANSNGAVNFDLQGSASTNVKLTFDIKLIAGSTADVTITVGGVAQTFNLTTTGSYYTGGSTYDFYIVPFSAPVALSNGVNTPVVINIVGNKGSTSRSISRFFSVSVSKNGIWTGGTSTNWADSSNWSSNTVPSSSIAVTIGAGTFQPVLAEDKTVQSLTINSTSSLNVAAGKVLSVAGAISNNGNLILKSDTSGTASLLSTVSAANVTQQRYLSNAQRGWRLLSNPLATTTFSAITAASNITLGTGFTGAYDSTTNTWSSTDASASFETQKAYKVFITGKAGESPAYTTGPSNVTLSVSGTAANTAPSEMTTVATKYYLVANPYTAPVSLVSILAASTNLSNSVSYYNPTQGSNGTTDLKVKKGGYNTIIVSGVAGSATDVILPPMGAIFVQASTAGTINVPKTAIFTGTTEAYNHKTAQSKTAAAVALTLDIASNGVDYDKLQLRFKEAGTTGSNIDFGKLPNSILDFYSINEGNNMAISELELKEQTIPLGVTSTEQKSFTLKVAENTIPVGYNAVLVDNVLNTNTVLAPGTTYDFAIDNSAASQGNARFAITLKTAGTLSVAANELDSKIQLWPNPAHNQFNITNAQNQNDGASTIEISSVHGQVIHSQKSNPGTTTTVQTNGWAAGVYILKATNNNIQTTQKLIIQ